MNIKIADKVRYTKDEVNVILEMYDLLHQKQLTIGQAIKLIDGLKASLVDARHTEANKIML